MTKLRFQIRCTDVGGKRMWRLGLRVGYWPCLRAPFVEADFWCWRIAVWYGLPSYKQLHNV